jgi:UDP-3-O-[3-hydroxymyristoyl] glucosamine N-acyltransferase
MAAQVGIAGSTIIGKNCVFGGQAGISGHTTIGDGVKIGPQAGVMSSVAPKTVLIGSPAFDYKSALKSFSIIRNLPQLRNDIIELQKNVKSLENKE